MIAFSIFWFDIYYYGIFYAASFLLWFLYIKYILSLWKYIHVNNKVSFLDDIFFYIVLWVLIWGRLGYVFFYNFDYFLENPLKIFYVWEGWMAFVWAFVWVGIALYLLSKKYKVSFYSISDLILSFAPFGILLWRFWNYLNWELYGKACPESLVWTFLCNSFWTEQIYFSNQLLEAFFEGLLLFIVFQFLVHKKNILLKRWFITILFVLSYSFIRFILEFFRNHEESLLYAWLSISQFFMILFFILWNCLLYSKFKR